MVGVAKKRTLLLPPPPTVVFMLNVTLVRSGLIIYIVNPTAVEKGRIAIKGQISKSGTPLVVHHPAARSTGEGRQVGGNSSDNFEIV